MGITRDIFQFVRNENTKNKHAGIKRKFEEKVTERDSNTVFSCE